MTIITFIIIQHFRIIAEYIHINVYEDFQFENTNYVYNPYMPTRLMNFKHFTSNMLYLF